MVEDRSVDGDQPCGGDRFGRQPLVDQQAHHGHLADHLQRLEPGESPVVQGRGGPHCRQVQDHRLGRLLSKPDVEDAAVCLLLNRPAGQKRGGNLGNLEPLGNEEPEPLHRLVQDSQRDGGVEPLVGLGHFVDDHAASHHGTLQPGKPAVERHHQGHVARPGQELEPGHSGGLVHHAAGHVRTAFDFHVAGHREPERCGWRTRQAQVEHLGGSGGFQRGNHLQHELVAPFALDEQRERPVLGPSHGGAPAVQRGAAKAHAR